MKRSKPATSGSRFQRRAQWFAGIVAVLALLIAGRLVQIQVVNADYYEQLGSELLIQPDIILPAPRGTIYDRAGRPLLRDEASSDIAVHYQVLTFSDRERYLRQVARQLRRLERYPGTMPTTAIVDELQDDIARMWTQLEQLSDKPTEEIVAEADALRRRVEIIRRAVEARTGNRHVLEERMFHPVLEGVDADLALAARMQLERYPWLRVVPSSRRVSYDANSLAHLLGQTGEASAERIAADPEADDPLRRLRPGDRVGTSGVERMAERILRGTRGRIARDADGNELSRTEPIPGDDVYLTIDREIQRAVFDILAAGVEASPTPSGGAAVVIDATTREVLALVSYPTFAFDDYREDYVDLRRDTKHLPLRARAIAAAYPPGSTCKAITLVGALSDGVISPHDTFACRPGYLLPERPDRYRCWYYNQRLLYHEPQDAELAVKNSCNMYFYKVGDKLGAERLCDWFAQFGLGRTQGTGLIGESPGILPTEAWLTTRGRQRERGHAWIYAIGQGDVVATPIQVANVATAIVRGQWAPVRFARDAEGNWINPHEAAGAPLSGSALRTLRAGMWRVVNERGGTARYARLDVPGYEFCGKTGSAQATPHVVNYRFVVEWADGQREDVIAPTEADALLRFADDEARPKVVGRFAHERYPPLEYGEKLPAHAWFMGYTQPADTPRGAAPVEDAYAIAVLVEFGGSGGSVAGPIAKAIAEHLLQRASPPMAEQR